MSLGVEIKLNSFVAGVDESAPSVTLHNGDVIKADMIVGADGIKSRIREGILGDENVATTNSSNCAFAQRFRTS